MTSRIRCLSSAAKGLPLAALIVSCAAVAPVSPAPAAVSPALPTASTVYGTLSWREVAPMLSPRSHLSVVAADGSFYAIGGLLRGGETSLAFDRYDLLTDKWTALPALPAGTDHAMAAVVNNASIFVFGGSFGLPSAHAFRFDLATNRWASVAPLPEPRAAGGAAVIASRIYVLGGFDATRRLLATGYSYDPATDKWTRIADLPTPREHLAVAAFRGSVCAIGGHYGNGRAVDVAECYEPTTNRWSTLPPLLRTASDFDAAVAADALWAVGDDVQVFDGTHWSLGPALRTPRFGIALASSGSSLIAVGGAARRPAPDGVVERLDFP